MKSANQRGLWNLEDTTSEDWLSNSSVCCF